MPETAIAFALFFFSGLVMALFVKPVYGLYTYIGVFYLHPPSRWWGDFLPDLRWSLIAAAVTLISVAIRWSSFNGATQWYKSPILGLFVAYVVWMWMQATFAISDRHTEGIILFTKYLMLIIVFYKIVDNEKDFRGVCMAHVLGCAYFGILVFLAPDGGRLEGVGGPGVNDANTLGMHLSTGLMFASFLLLANKGITRWVVLASIPFILNGVIQTETRGALVGLFAGALMTVYLKPKRISSLYYTLAALGVVVFITLANQAFLERMSTLNAAISEEQEWDSSAQSRVEIAKSQFEMFKDHPLGVGHQGTVKLSPRYIDERWLVGSTGLRASHNTFMSVLVDQGILGIILFTLIAWYVLKVLVRLKRWDKRGLPLNFGLYRTMLGGSLCSIMAAGMFAQYLKAEVQIWCLVLLVILHRLAGQAVQEAEAPETAGVGVKHERPSARSVNQVAR